MARKITLNLAGGLGNQFFQLCAGLYLQKKLNLEIVYDLSNLKLNQSKRKNSTTRSLQISELILNSKTKFRPIRIYNLLYWYRKKIDGKKYLFEKDENDNLLDRVSPQTISLSGFFQRSELAFDLWPELSKLIIKSKEFSPLIDAEIITRIAIHIRFGDYYANLSTKKVYGLTDPSYYLKAVAYFKNLHSDLKDVLVVTDDEEAARVFLNENESNLQFLIKSDKNPVSDLVELARSSHIIISNSTFSWWGGFFGYQVRGSQVIYPRPWMADESDPELPIFVKEWTSFKRNYEIS